MLLDKIINAPFCRWGHYEILITVLIEIKISHLQEKNEIILPPNQQVSRYTS